MIPTQRVDNQIHRPPAQFIRNLSQNTDEQITDLACQALRATGYCQLRHLQVYYEHGRITLQGQLPTYYLKQVAQSVILQVDGVREIDNDVRISS